MVSLGEFLTEIINRLDMGDIHIEILILDAEIKQSGDNESVLYKLCVAPEKVKYIVNVFNDALFQIGDQLSIDEYLRYIEYILYLKNLMAQYCIMRNIAKLYKLSQKKYNRKLVVEIKKQIKHLDRCLDFTEDVIIPYKWSKLARFVVKELKYIGF
jgi:hypothetical protein